MKLEATGKGRRNPAESPIEELQNNAELTRDRVARAPAHRLFLAIDANSSFYESISLSFILTYLYD